MSQNPRDEKNQNLKNIYPEYNEHVLIPDLLNIVLSYLEKIKYYSMSRRNGDGEEKTEIRYFNGKKHGNTIVYYKGRKLSVAKYYDDNLIKSIEYFDNGKIKNEEYYYNNELQGLCHYWTHDGILEYSSTFDRNDSFMHKCHVCNRTYCDTSFYKHIHTLKHKKAIKSFA